MVQAKEPIQPPGGSLLVSLRTKTLTRCFPSTGPVTASERFERAAFRRLAHRLPRHVPEVAEVEARKAGQDGVHDLGVGQK